MLRTLRATDGGCLRDQTLASESARGPGRRHGIFGNAVRAFEVDKTRKGTRSIPILSALGHCLGFGAPRGTATPSPAGVRAAKDLLTRTMGE